VFAEPVPPAGPGAGAAVGRWAWPVVALVSVAWTVAWIGRTWTPSGLSWHFFVTGADALFGGTGLRTYADHPELQIGPLSLLVTPSLAWLPGESGREFGQVLMALAGPLLLGWLVPLMPVRHRIVRWLLAVVVLVPTWMVLAVRWAHADDVLAMVFAVAAVRAVRAERPVLTGLALAAAIAAKPWAIGFVPLILVLQRDRMRAAITVAAAVAAFSPLVKIVQPIYLGCHPGVLQVA